MRPCLPLLLLSCAGDNLDSVPDDPAAFCSTLDEVGTWEQLDEPGVAASSGVLYARIITDQSEDPRDPYYVAYRSFAIEPAETGGVQTTGTTSGDGIMQKTVGVGNWAFKATWSRGSTTCLAEATIPVASQQLTRACVLLTCPDE